MFDPALKQKIADSIQAILRQTGEFMRINKFNIIVSSWSSKIMMALVLIYLFLKTLINPVFITSDLLIAVLLAEVYPTYTADWLHIIIGALSNDDEMVYLPEARADLLFELKSYFKGD
jgi:hypothetical protein